MHPILVLWGTPRSTSTAFEWMMRTRGDMTCFHEPFGEAWYQGEEALWPRLKPDSAGVAGHKACHPDHGDGQEDAQKHHQKA